MANNPAVNRVCRILLVVVSLVSSASAAAASVQTIDGKQIEGDLKAEAGHLVVSRTGALPVKVEVENILSLRVDGGEKAAKPATPPRWTSRDVGVPGELRVLGSARFGDSSLTVRGAGNVGPESDALHFVYQGLAGDGQITVRVASLAKSDALAKAGLMFRSGLDPAASCAAVFAHADERPCFMARERGGQGAKVTPGMDADVPVYLRLVREGDQFTGYSSADGQNWDEIASATVKLPKAALVGVFVASRHMHVLTTANFERLSVVARELAAPDEPAPGQLASGLILRGGSSLAGRPRFADDTTVRFARQREGELSVPRRDVASLLFLPMTPALAARVPAGRAGVLLTNGDFIEGDLKSLDLGRVRISSILFGLQRFEIAQVAAIFLKPAETPAGRYELRTSDGSVLLADELKVDKEGFLVHLNPLPALRVMLGELIELNAGPSRFVPLSRLKYQRPSPVPDGRAVFAVDSTPEGNAPMLRGIAHEKGLGLAAGARISFPLQGAYRALLLKAGVVDTVLPSSPVTLVIVVDGKDTYRSPPITSLDQPLSIALGVAGAQSVEIRVEPAGPPAFSPSLFLAEPALIQ
jgi:hypothetical protein